MHVSCFDRLHGTCSAERGGKEDSCSEKWAHLNWRASQTWSGQKFVRVSQMKSEQLWNKFLRLWMGACFHVSSVFRWLRPKMRISSGCWWRQTCFAANWLAISWLMWSIAISNSTISALSAANFALSAEVRDKLTHTSTVWKTWLERR